MKKGKIKYDVTLFFPKFAQLNGSFRHNDRILYDQISDKPKELPFFLLLSMHKDNLLLLLWILKHIKNQIKNSCGLSL